MNVTSLGHRTDLMMLRLGGSQIEDAGGHLVIRSPHNPHHWWGNFLLFETAPEDGDLVRWESLFATEFPAATHRAFGVDGSDGDRGSFEQFQQAGYDVSGDTVMTATTVHQPPHPNEEATYRPLDLTDPRDLRSAIDVQLGNNDDIPPADYLTFVEAKMTAMRGLQVNGHGSWFGAFLGRQMLSGMGLFTDGSGVARFQSVDTVPEARGRGLAGSLVHHVSQYAFSALGVQTLVMVAEPDYLAIRLYRSVGFTDSESMVQIERAP